MVIIIKEDRKYKRFGLKNALIGFPGEEKNDWGKISNISKGGFKMLSDRDFDKGEIFSALIDLRGVPDQALFPNHFEIKIKIIWKYQNMENQGMKNAYGACFNDLGERENGLLDSLFESLNKSKKASNEDVDDVLMEIDTYLEQFRK